MTQKEIVGTLAAIELVVVHLFAKHHIDLTEEEFSEQFHVHKGVFSKFLNRCPAVDDQVGDFSNELYNAMDLILAGASRAHTKFRP